MNESKSETSGVEHFAILSSQIICPKCRTITLRYTEDDLLECKPCGTFYTPPKVMIHEFIPPSHA